MRLLQSIHLSLILTLTSWWGADRLHAQSLGSSEALQAETSGDLIGCRVFSLGLGTRLSVLHENVASEQHLLSLPAPRNANHIEFQFDTNNRWSTTATNGGGLLRGDPMTLTWGIIDDGVSIPGANDEPTSPSDLIAFLDGIYGAGPGGTDLTQRPWFPVFQQIFTVWAQLTGVRYVYEPNDDGAAFSDSPGVLGVRADVRVGGHFIDGEDGSNTLAYNFFPDNGDMVIDTSNNAFYSDLSNNSLGLRNVLSHEHGHGLGIDHVCPTNETKLMEPFISDLFDGPQEDDILAGNRGYGDRDEFPNQNDSFGNATGLGFVAVGNSAARTSLSVDGVSDQDFYSFSVAAGTRATVTINPTGTTYLDGPQNPNGSCSGGTNFNALTQNNLDVQLLATNGTTVLATANANGAGVAEVITNQDLTDGAGTYFLRIFGDAATDQVQIYNLSVDISTGGPVCSITDLAAGTQTACDPGSNTYTQQVVVTYSNPPAGGTLDVHGQSFAITGSPQTVTLTGLNSDGAPVNVTASFAAEPACSRTENALFTAPVSCAPVCTITDLQAGTQTLCNPANNTYTQEVVVFYSNAPAGGTLDVLGQSFAITVSPQMVLLTGLTADGAPVNVTASFSAQPGCSRTENALFTAPASCAPLCWISDLAAGAQTTCDGGSNTYTQEVVVTYANPPVGGTLDVNGQSFAIATSPQTVTLIGLNANGATVNVTASFSAQASCSRTENNLFTAPASCGFVSACMPEQPIDIPDDDPDGITSVISFPDTLEIQEVQIFLDIEHPWIGDLIVELTHNGTTVRLHDQTGDDADDILGTYPIQLTVDGPGDLDNFNGQLSNGNWTLFVSDNGFPDDGRLWDWCVDVRGNQVATDVGPDPESPTLATLFPSHPNPAPGGVTHIRFAVPTPQHVELHIYDVSGRRVRTLYEGDVTRGSHELRWNGADQHGSQVASGIYFYRLQTAGVSRMRKVVVIR